MDIVLNTVFNNPKLPTVKVSYFSDDFNRADATVLGNTQIGNLPWSLSSSNTTVPQGRIISNAANVWTSGAANTARVAATVNASRADGVLTATLRSGLLVNVSNLTFRFTDASNHLFLSPTTAGGTVTWQLYSRVSGTSTKLVDSGIPAANGDQLQVTLSGASIIVKINGVQGISTSSAQLQTATSYGFVNTAIAGADVILWDSIELASR